MKNTCKTQAIQTELPGFGFEVQVETISKSVDTAIQSAFIKGGTRVNFLNILAPESISSKTQEKSRTLSLEDARHMLQARFRAVDWESAKQDVRLYIRDPIALEVWSTEFFEHMLSKLTGA